MNNKQEGEQGLIKLCIAVCLMVLITIAVESIICLFKAWGS